MRWWWWWCDCGRLNNFPYKEIQGSGWHPSVNAIRSLHAVSYPWFVNLLIINGIQCRHYPSDIIIIMPMIISALVIIINLLSLILMDFHYKWHFIGRPTTIWLTITHSISTVQRLAAENQSLSWFPLAAKWQRIINSRQQQQRLTVTLIGAARTPQTSVKKTVRWLTYVLIPTVTFKALIWYWFTIKSIQIRGSHLLLFYSTLAFGT